MTWKTYLWIDSAYLKYRRWTGRNIYFNTGWWPWMVKSAADVAQEGERIRRMSYPITRPIKDQAPCN